jgi:lycopene cyclase domain-containing protein
MLLSLAGPLALSFDKKVAFYKKWKRLFTAMILPAVFYIVWDMVFTKQGVWSFNENYITGIKLYNLPIEEVMFFFVVPYCCVFIYECVRCYFPKIQRTAMGNGILNFIGIVLLVMAMFNHDKAYTFFTFFFNGIFIFILASSKKRFQSFNTNAFLVSYLIILIPFLIINGLLTAIPVVLYNDHENLATRIYTIPVEDVFYGMLLVMMNVVGYEAPYNSPKGGRVDATNLNLNSNLF